MSACVLKRNRSRRYTQGVFSGLGNKARAIVQDALEVSGITGRGLFHKKRIRFWEYYGNHPALYGFHTVALVQDLFSIDNLSEASIFLNKGDP